MAEKPRAFDSQTDFRNWLKSHHATTSELVILCYKTHAQDRGLTYRQALDEALCFGWIDGVRRAVDEESFSVRFTPRKPKSYWSAVNIRRATELGSEGRMHAAGSAAFEARERAKREETRDRRLAELIARSATREPIKLLDRRPPAAG